MASRPQSSALLSGTTERSRLVKVCRRSFKVVGSGTPKATCLPMAYNYSGREAFAAILLARGPIRGSAPFVTHAPGPAHPHASAAETQPRGETRRVGPCAWQVGQEIILGILINAPVSCCLFGYRPRLLSCCIYGGILIIQAE